MFAQLERLGVEDINEEDLKKEIERGKAISELGKVIVESAKTEIFHLKLMGRLDHNNPPNFLEDEEPKKLRAAK